MKSSEILTLAAELVDGGSTAISRDAIASASGLHGHFFVALEWFRETHGSLVTCANQNHRVIALLLCAAIAESEGD